MTKFNEPVIEQRNLTKQAFEGRFHNRFIFSSSSRQEPTKNVDYNEEQEISVIGRNLTRVDTIIRRKVTDHLWIKLSSRCSIHSNIVLAIISAKVRIMQMP